MTFGRLFKDIVQPLIILATSICLLVGCSDQERVDKNFSLAVILKDYVINTKNLLSVTRDWGLRKKDFDGQPNALQVDRFTHIQSLLKIHGIKFIDIEKSSTTVEFNFADSGVFGRYYLSLVYSEAPKKATILNTPEVWRCISYKKDRWYMCKGVE